MAKRKFADIGILCKGKDGNHYIKVENDVEITIKQKKYNGDEVTVKLEGGSYINLQKPEEKFSIMFRGDESKVGERLETTPDYIKYFASASSEA